MIKIKNFFSFLIRKIFAYKEKRRQEKEEYYEIIHNINEKKQELDYLSKKISSAEIVSQGIEKELMFLDQQYEQGKENIDLKLKDYQNSLSSIKDHYFKTLEDSYTAAEVKYNIKVNQLNQQIQDIQAYLEKEKATMQATIEAKVREKEIKEKLSFYCLQITDLDKADINRLENIKSSLNKPRVLSMLIWQTWFQKPLKTLSAQVLGLNTVTGIYKITNIITEECYIGQARNVAERWAEHAKCGLGIDTPAGNKLYEAMKNYGIWNFSWELLEACPKEQLNEKERYYINLYHSNELGYNSNSGVKK